MKLTTSSGFGLHNAVIGLIALVAMGCTGAVVARHARTDLTPMVDSTRANYNCATVNDQITLINAVGADDAEWTAAIAGGNPVIIVTKLKSGVKLLSSSMVVRVGPHTNPEAFASYRWDADLNILVP